jgi:hypothetical protein
MDEDTARWVRVEAAKAGKRVARWLDERLAEQRRGDVAWETGPDERVLARNRCGRSVSSRLARTRDARADARRAHHRQSVYHRARNGPRRIGSAHGF